MVERTPAIDIAGLELGPEIGRGAHTVVYQARRGDEKVAVKVATLAPESAGDAAVRFRREAGVLASVRHSALPVVLDVGETGSHAYIVLEYVEGTTLGRRVAEQPVAEEDVVAIGRTLASALSALHRHGLVHRDVKPDNVVLDLAGRVRLIDFGLATEALRPADGSFAGSLLYSAPEQSGLLRRGVDGRADLYSLGCILFECVARRPPFEGRTLSELLHIQASTPAPDLHTIADASPGFAAIVGKLLAKDPDDRYQSATGLLADLDRVETLNALAEAGLGLSLGQHDVPADAPEEMRLVGREAELEQLRGLWAASLTGRSQLVLVQGEVGIGKSRLARELVRYVRGRGGLVLVARGSESGGASLAPFREAIERWLRQVPEPERAETTEIVRSAGRPQAALARRLSPVLASLLPSVDEPPGADDPTQLVDALAGLVAGIARARGGLLVFVDDAQWLDDASRAVLERLTESAPDAPLLVLAAARTEADDEAAPAEPDRRSSAATLLQLGPLSQSAAAALVGQLLGVGEADDAVVAEIAPRSAGNPLAVGELVKAMLDAGVLRPHAGRWTVRSESIPGLELPDGTPALLLRRLQAMSGSVDEVAGPAASSRPLRQLEALQAVALATARVLEPDRLARVALDEVIRVMGAERSFLFVVGDAGELRLKAGRGASGADLVELHGYSRTVVDTVAAERRPLLVSAGTEGPVADSESIVAHDLRSIVAAPLLVGERLVGVLYLDNRLARGVFGDDDVAAVAAIAAQVAVASETASAFTRQAALADENARLLETVREQLAELRLSRGRVAAAEERLRREIAELLHSRVQTRLLVAWHRLGQAVDLVRRAPDEAAAAIEQVRDEIDQIREREIRSASHQLHPAVIRVGLVPALRSLAARFDDQFAVAVDADASVAELDDPAENRIPEGLRLTAYRVAEEALANVARHAGATSVTIALRIDDGRLLLSVRDDGGGFDGAQRGEGLGLTSVTMRVESVGGELRIVGDEGSGTTLSVVIPLAGSAAAPQPARLSP